MQRNGLRILLCLLAPVMAAGAAGADIVEQITALTPARARGYEQVMALLDRYRDNPRVEVHTIGTSREGRAIPLVVVKHPEVALEHTARLFIIARQHGTEVSGTTATLALLEHFARSNDEFDLQILEQLSFVMVPATNPDGMVRSRRANAAGVDLNRDWATRSQPETRAVDNAVRRFAPHALIDMHELPAHHEKPAYQENFIQTFGTHGQLPVSLVADCTPVSGALSTWMRHYRIPLNVYFDGPGGSQALCHRYFGLSLHIPSYLFEVKTGSGRPLVDRVRFHVLGTLVVGNHIIHRYHAPPPVYMAENPAEAQAPDPPVAEAEAAGEPQPVELAFETPQQDGQVVRGILPVRLADIEPCNRFAYITLSIDGEVQTLSNTLPYRYSLDTARLENGSYRLTVTACDAVGRKLAETGRTIIVDNAVLAAE